MIFSCSSFKHIKNNYNKDTDLGYFGHAIIQNNNKNYDQKIRSDIQNLQTINVIYFPFDQYCVLSNFFSILDMHANFLRNHPSCHIRIEGHTDERGTPEYNIALGERRAYSVKAYLHSKGVLSEQMQIISYGKEKPVSFDHTEESYSKNRRVVLLY